jgi:hypothetical protein
MAAVHSQGGGHTLQVTCDRCGKEVMAFGRGPQGRPELEAEFRADGWQHLGGDGWLCQRCAPASPRTGGSGRDSTLPPVTSGRRGCRRLWLVLGLLGFAVLTAGKWLFNAVETGLYDAYNAPAARTAGDAETQGMLVARFRIDPPRLAGGDKVYEFEAAWLQAADVPVHRLVWFSYRTRADWCYLCVRPRTKWFQDDFSFNPAPEYQEPFEVTGLGQKGIRWVQSGNDLYFQKVPLDLRELDIRVFVFTYGKGKDFEVGRAHLTRID